MPENGSCNDIFNFSKFDKAIESLVVSISNWDKKRNGGILPEKREKKRRVIKKLNVDLIRKVLQETQELQKKKV